MLDMQRTWPDDWERRRAGENCPMCSEGRPAENGYGIRFFAGKVSDAYLQRSTPQPGYTVAVWRGSHVADPSEMGPEYAAAYWHEILRVARGLTEVFRPCHVNYMIWGNLVPHLHTHLVLRYVDDPSPGEPLMPFEASPVPDNELHDQVARLRAALRPA
jgi:diadenosine tetraphosphate (Ap4A) HIT family hydrolase